MDYKWINFDDGKSIGQKGSEGGKIIRDEENTFGARVTLEDKGDVAPFSITLGIYGLMFHTEFFSTIDQGQRCFESYKEKIELVVEHYSIKESDRDAEWTTKHNQMMDEILNVS
ncbi:MAG: hypothetical protein ABI663_12015 [Chryseolinea sp.]